MAAELESTSPASEGRAQEQINAIIGDPTQTPSANDQEAAELPKDTGDPEYVTGVKLTLLVTALALACFVMLLDTSIISTAIPQITDEFQSLRDIGWYGSSYNLASAVVQPLTGMIYHHFRLKWSFLGMFTLFEVGSAVCGSAQSSAVLITGRALAGAGAAGIINGSLTILSASAPVPKQPALLGMLMGICQLGLVLGPIIGGAFTTGYTWRWSFYVNLPIGALVAIPLVLIQFPEQIPKRPTLVTLRETHHYFDLLGFVFYSGAVIQLLLALEYGGNSFSWNSSEVIGLFCGSGVACIVWLVWSYYKKDDALFPISVVTKRVIWMSALNYGFMVSSILGASYFLPIYFQAVKGVNAVLSGVYYLPSIGPQVIFAIISGRLVTKIGYIAPFSVFAGILIAIGGGLHALLQPGSSVGQWVGFQIITGVGRGAGIQMPILATQNSIEPVEIARAMSFLVTLQLLMPAIFLTLYNIVFDGSLRTEMATHAPMVDASLILELGTTRFRRVVSVHDLPGVLVAYSNSLDHVFSFVAATGVMVFVTGWGMGWNNIRKPRDAPGNQTNLDADNSTEDTDLPSMGEQKSG